MVLKVRKCQITIFRVHLPEQYSQICKGQGKGSQDYRSSELQTLKDEGNHVILGINRSLLY